MPPIYGKCYMAWHGARNSYRSTQKALVTWYGYLMTDSQAFLILAQVLVMIVSLGQSFSKLTLKDEPGSMMRLALTSCSASGFSIAERAIIGIPGGNMGRRLLMYVYSFQKYPPHCVIQCDSSTTVIQTVCAKLSACRTFLKPSCLKHISSEANMA
jgi:hypothetical protein